MELLIALLTSTALSSLIQFFFNRKDKKCDRLDKIEKSLERLELDITRLRLRVIIKEQPKNHGTIMRIAHKYFIELGGDEEMFDLYHKWQVKEGVNTTWWSSVVSREKEK